MPWIAQPMVIRYFHSVSSTIGAPRISHALKILQFWRKLTVNSPLKLADKLIAEVCRGSETAC